MSKPFLFLSVAVAYCVLCHTLCFRRQWVREEDLAKDLKLHSKQLRRTLRFFEEEKLVTRDHRREVSHDYNHHVLLYSYWLFRICLVQGITKLCDTF